MVNRTGSPRLHVAWWAGRAVLLSILVVGAYWLSLGSLWSDLGGQTPLAFVGLAPMLALAVLVAGLRRRDPLPFPTRTDLVIGLLLIFGAATIVVLGPSLTSIYFWTARLDILSLPLFAAGAMIALFGWRVLFVARGAIFLLLMAWPLPYLVLLENTSEMLTSATAQALAVVVSVVPIARPVLGDPSLFNVTGASPFQIQVATACAGLNSTVAFLLVGGALLLVLRGRWLAKLLWLACGVALVFAFNVVRVILLVAVGSVFGQDAAFGFFHPVAGIVALMIGFGIMLGLMARFGLTMPRLIAAAPTASPWPVSPDAATPRRRLPARFAVLAVVALMFGVVNSTFAAYGQSPALTDAASIRPVMGSIGRLGGWRVVQQHDINIGKPYFGYDSTWTRYRLSPPLETPRDQQYTIFADSITVTDRKNLTDFGVEKCYRFHGHSIDAAQPVALGSGIVGSEISVTRKSGEVWVVLWWEWPVEKDGVTLHERVVLLATTKKRPVTVDRVGQPTIVIDLGTAISADLRPLADNMASVAARIVTQQVDG